MIKLFSLVLHKGSGSTDDPGKSKFQQCIIDLKTAASAAYHHPVAVCLRRTDCVLCGLRDLAFFVDHCSVYIKKYYLFIHFPHCQPANCYGSHCKFSFYWLILSSITILSDCFILSCILLAFNHYTKKTPENRSYNPISGCTFLFPYLLSTAGYPPVPALNPPP